MAIPSRNGLLIIHGKPHECHNNETASIVHTSLREISAWQQTALSLSEAIWQQFTPARYQFASM